jgi:hypothetical protein
MLVLIGPSGRQSQDSSYRDRPPYPPILVLQGDNRGIPFVGSNEYLPMCSCLLALGRNNHKTFARRP